MNQFKVIDMRIVPGDSGFLIDDGKCTVLYDTGFGFTGYEMADKIRKYLGDRKLDYIFLTHSHYDHALGSAYITKVFPDTKVVAGEYTAKIFTRDGAKATMKDLDNKFAEKSGYPPYEFLGDDLHVDIPVKEGDIIKAGSMTFDVISLPGHTKCSVGFYLKEHKILLATETLGVYNGDKMIVPSFLVGYDMTLQSIDKALRLDINEILSPHYGILTEEQTAFFIENMRSEAVDSGEFILSMLKKKMSKEEISDAVFERYIKGYVDSVYPEDAARLNTSIMIDLIEKELL